MNFHQCDRSLEPDPPIINVTHAFSRGKEAYNNRAGGLRTFFKKTLRASSPCTRYSGRISGYLYRCSPSDIYNILRGFLMPGHQGAFTHSLRSKFRCCSIPAGSVKNYLSTPPRSPPHRSRGLLRKNNFFHGTG